MYTEKEWALLFKALGDEHRIHILNLLRGGEKCACHLLEAMDISQPTLSHHMKILCDAGIVTAHKDGKWIHYSICRETVNSILELMQEPLPADNLPENCCCKENCC